MMKWYLEAVIIHTHTHACLPCSCDDLHFWKITKNKKICPRGYHPLLRMVMMKIAFVGTHTKFLVSLPHEKSERERDVYMGL
jgi:hypothetical protein